MSARAGARPTRRSAQTRQRIIEAATEVFARRGVHGTRVADIAENAGVAYGLVYHHFRNKEEILTAIFAERWAQYVTYLEDLARTPASFRERMGRLVHFWVETFRQETDLMTVMINEITRSYEFLDSHDITAVLAAFEPIQRIIAEGVDNGEVRADLDAQLATYVVLGVAEMVLTGYVIGSLARSDQQAFARDEAQLLSLLLDGMSVLGR